MTAQIKDVVTPQTCKLITDAQNEKIEAAKVLWEAKFQGIKNTIYVASLILGISLTMMQILLNYLWH